MQGYLSILPVVVIILAIRGYPMFTAVAKSFTNWDGLYKNDWVGLRNYISLLRTGDFWMLLRNTLILLVNVPLQIVVGLFVSVLLYERTLGWRFFRSLYYMPQVVSPLVVGSLFNFLFGNYGPVNHVLRSLGLQNLATEWLGNGVTALAVIVLCLVWLNIGWQGILLLGGLSSLDPAILDSARIDGANYWQRTFRIFLPSLARIVEYSLIVSVAWTFTGLFPIIHSITRGGPGYRTTTIDYMIYVKSFVVGNKLGEACALAMILLAIVTALTAVQMYVVNRREARN